jgi:hypothetical protein
MFIEIVSNDEARRLIAAGRKPYEFKTRDPAKGPIFGPGYDDPGELNRAKKSRRFAEDLEAAQQCARLVGTTIEGVSFLTGK